MKLVKHRSTGPLNYTKTCVFETVEGYHHYVTFTSVSEAGLASRISNYIAKVNKGEVNIKTETNEEVLIALKSFRAIFKTCLCGNDNIEYARTANKQDIFVCLECKRVIV